MTANGKINKNRVIPVQLTVEEDQKLVEENKGTYASPLVPSFEEKESPEFNRKVRVVSPLKSAGQAKVTVSKWRKYARKRAAWHEYQQHGTNIKKRASIFQLSVKA